METQFASNQVALSNQHIIFNYNKSYFYQKQGRLMEAKVQLHTILQNNPQFCEVYLRLAKIAYLENNMTELFEFLNVALFIAQKCQ